VGQGIFGEKTMRKAQKIFLQDVGQRLPQCQDALTVLVGRGLEREAWNTLYKFAHTVKGSGKMVELWNMAESAAEMGTALLLVKDYDVTLTAGVLQYLRERLTEIDEEMTVNSQPFTELPSMEPPAVKGQKILIVDDDRAITALVQEYLEQNGYRVTVCYDTYVAEELLQTEQPDLIVLDILFPCGDGIEFCRRIRSNPQWGIVPVIFLSVKGELQDKLAGFSTGADDYLCKPFKVEELGARIQAILNRLASSRELVLQDELTKVFNRRYLQMRLTKEIAAAKRRDVNFAVAMLDIDYFKKVNDRYGHLVGDEVLQCFTDKLMSNLRAADIICRYGGEEFVILMPDTSLENAYKIILRVQVLIGSQPLQLFKNQMEIAVTFSVGIAGFPQNGSSGEELLAAADHALYEAKVAGRNRVTLFGETASDLAPGR
jgi:two-component system cell cycle response regulator